MFLNITYEIEYYNTLPIILLCVQLSCIIYLYLYVNNKNTFLNKIKNQFDIYNINITVFQSVYACLKHSRVRRNNHHGIRYYIICKRKQKYYYVV